MSSRGLLAVARQLPAGTFLSTHISTSSTSHILNFVACYSSISHIPPFPLPLPMEVEVETPWGKIAGHMVLKGYYFAIKKVKKMH